LTMKVGEISELTVSGDKGYGSQGFPAWKYPFF
jgi:FKBP-type peptidyl-prolyl cis-trans isomerase